MASLYPKNLDWLKNLASVDAQLQANSDLTNVELGAALNLSPTIVSYLRTLRSCFDKEAAEKVRQADQGDKPYTLSLNSALALAGLKGKVTDLPTSFHDALDHVLLHELPTRHIKALVDWVASGKPAAEFNIKPPQSKKLGKKSEELGVRSGELGEKSEQLESEELGVKKGKKEPAPAKSKTPANGTDLDKLVELAKRAALEEAAPAEASGARQRKYQDELKNYLESLKLESEELGVKSTAKPHVSAPAAPDQMGILDTGSPHHGTGTSNAHASAGDLSLAEKLFWDFMAGIPIYKQIDSKLKKGVNPTSGEKFLLVWHVIWKGLGAALKIAGKIVKKLWKEGWKFLKELFKGKSFWGKTVTAAVLLIVVFWLVPSLFDHWVVYPLLHFKSKFFHADSQQTPAAISLSPQVTGTSSLSETQQAKSSQSEPLVSSTAKPKLAQRHEDAKETLVSETKPIPAPQNTYIPTHAWTVADEDQNYLEAELAALPPFCVIKPFAFVPDASMGAEMANHRLADLTNSEIYSMKIGHNTQKVLSVVPTSTDLTINYQGDLVGGFLDGSSKMEIYWEDVKAIHADEISSPQSSSGTPETLYQLSLVVSGAKQPLIIQCASARDLGHLASVLNYFIKTAGSAPVPLSSLPYPNQGLQLNDDSEITALWADSPADHAGLRLRDYLWSLETNWPSKENKTQLETGLQAFTSSPHQLYVVASADWEKAVNSNKNNNASITFNPPRHAVSLLIDY